MKIVVCVPRFEPYADEFRKVSNGDPVVFCRRDAPLEVWQGADVIVGSPPLSVVEKLEGLRLLQLQSAGVEPYSAVTRILPSCVLCCASGAYGMAMSEHMTAMLLSGMKKLELYRENQKKSVWQDMGPIKTVYGSNVLIVGLGDIGSHFARIMKAMGAFVTGIKRTPAPCPEYADRLFTAERLDECIPEADIIALTLPETAQTKRIIDEKRLSMMKPTALILNVGRGSAIDGEALAAALNEKRLGGAFLDVCEPEPLPKESPLWSAENLYLTPHISGGFHAEETVRRIVRIACSNINALEAGGRFISRVDPETGYRSTDSQAKL